MVNRSYEGSPLDGTIEYITERDFDEVSERLDAPSDETSEGDLQTTELSSFDLNKGQKVAKVCAETGITDSEEVQQEIEENHEFDVSKSHIINVVNRNVDVKGFRITNDGEPEFEEPVNETRQEVLRIGRLNQNESYRAIYQKCRNRGLDVTYAYVWELVAEHTPKEKESRDGSKKRAIIRIFNETKKTGSDLLQEIRNRGYDVSRAMLNKTLPEIDGYENAKPKTKKEKIREVAEQVEYENHRELTEHINQHEDFDVVRAYVSEALREQ